MQKPLLPICLLLSVLPLCPAPLLADPIPPVLPASFVEQLLNVSTAQTNYYGLGSEQLAPPVQSESASTEAEGGADPFVYAEYVSASRNSYQYGTSLVTLAYAFEVAGPSAPFVLVDLQGAGLTYSSGPYFAFANLSVYSDPATNFNSIYSESACSGSDCGTLASQSSFSVNQTLQIIPNQIYYISLQVEDEQYGQISSILTYSSVDPTLSLTAGESSQYTLYESPDIDSAPEPSTFLLLGTGILGLTGVVRRKLLHS